ncbi:MAG TPA: FHA domain-containing protein, partial [Polyangiaceae bacterium]|nr:FHA domain-containing protein [Polyangiaceae bacterium]
MISTGGAESILPSQLVDDAHVRDERAFLLLYGDAPILLIRIPPGDAELQHGLEAMEAGSGRIPFRTEAVSEPRMVAAPRRSERPGDPAQLASELAGGTYFAFSMRKRTDDKALASDRVTVGRTSNRDLVLRHASVSKFHAWFEADADATVSVTDAESKNQTFINATALAPRTKTRVAPGALVRFGSVECRLWTARNLWAVLRRRHPSGGRVLDRAT